MKKVLLLAFTILLIMVACRKPTIKSSEYIQKELLSVMYNKSAFFDSNGQSIFLENYQIPGYEEYAFSPFEYALVNFDDDKEKELVISDTQQNFYLILRYDKSKDNIYGYPVNMRSLITLKNNGEFMQSSGSGINSINRLYFKNGKIVFVELAFKNDYENQYRINKRVVESKTINTYFDEWNKQPDVFWNNIKGTQGTVLCVVRFSCNTETHPC